VYRDGYFPKVLLPGHGELLESYYAPLLSKSEYRSLLRQLLQRDGVELAHELLGGGFLDELEACGDREMRKVMVARKLAGKPTTVPETH
jgi:hypothetical protein